MRTRPSLVQRCLAGVLLLGSAGGAGAHHTAAATLKSGTIDVPGGMLALDQAVFTLAEWEIRDALLNAGDSTVLGLGSMPGRDGWPVRAGGGGPIPLHDQPLSGTGFENKGAHIIDPRTCRTVRTARILR